MPYKKLIEEELQWLRETLPTGVKVTPKLLRESGTYDAFVKKYGKRNIYMMVRQINEHSGKKTQTVATAHSSDKNRAKFLKTAAKSNYIVITPFGHVAGFTTADEVRRFITDSGITSGVLLFERKEVKVKCVVKF